MSTSGALGGSGAPMTGGVPRSDGLPFFERYKYWLIVGGVALAAIVLIKVVGRLRSAEDADKQEDEWGHVEAPMRPHGIGAPERGTAPETPAHALGHSQLGGGAPF